MSELLTDIKMKTVILTICHLKEILKISDKYNASTQTIINRVPIVVMKQNDVVREKNMSEGIRNK